MTYSAILANAYRLADAGQSPRDMQRLADRIPAALRPSLRAAYWRARQESGTVAPTR